MESASETIEPLARPHAAEWTPARPRLARAQRALHDVRFALMVYLASRVLLFAVAIVNGQLRHRSLLDELSNWDGFWYRSIANVTGHGTFSPTVANLVQHEAFYPHHVYHAADQPRASSPATRCSCGWSPTPSTGSPVTDDLVGHRRRAALIRCGRGHRHPADRERLRAGWWGAEAARRAVVLFCLFPGSVIFSMVYAEGIVIPLAAGCILALQQRRWMLAGSWPGRHSGRARGGRVGPVCAVAALRARATRARARGPSRSRAAQLACARSLDDRDRRGRRIHVGLDGTPFATFTTQHYGWRERTDPLALVHLVTRFAGEISFTHFNHPTINLNYPVGIVGALSC